MLPTLAKVVPLGLEWLHEAKSSTAIAPTPRKAENFWSVGWSFCFKIGTGTSNRRTLISFDGPYIVGIGILRNRSLHLFICGVTQACERLIVGFR